MPGAHLARLDPDDIVPNAPAAAQRFDPDDLAELVHSIREFGVLQPIVVRRTPTRSASTSSSWVSAAPATKAAGLDTIPAVVKDTADEAMLRDALLENLHRSQLNPLEEASAYQQLLADFGITQEELATRIGRSRPQISNTLRLLKLPSRSSSRRRGRAERRARPRDPLARGPRGDAAPRRQDRERGPVGARRGGDREAEPRSRRRPKPAAGKRRTSSTTSPTVSATASTPG